VGLTYIAREPQTSPAIATLVLLHGLGADEHDLIGLATELDPRLKVVSVRAPLHSEWGGYSWFGIDLSSSELRIDAEEARESLEKLRSFLTEIEGPILLGGFSQGAMMTIGVLLEHEDLIVGAIAMSGGKLPCFEPTGQSPKPIFMSHGRMDPVVPFEFGQTSAHELEALGHSVNFHAYSMGHTISEECMSDLSSWVYNCLQFLRNS
jgi:phospholipase/carboxylesterase